MIQIILLGILASLFYFYAIKPMNYWTRKGVKQEKQYWLFGETYRFLFRLQSLADFLLDVYRKNAVNRYFGTYLFTEPILVVKDPELIKQLTIRYFDNFLDHAQLIPNNDPLWNKNLLSLTGQKWHDARPIISRNFTSSKMKAMFMLMADCAKDFTENLASKNKNLTEFEAKALFSRYSTDVIATTVFGFKTDSLKEENNEFYLTGKEVANTGSLSANIKIISFTACPRLYRMINIQYFGRKARTFFLDIIDKNVKEREEKGIVRPDLIHILLQAKKGTENNEEHNAEKTLQNVNKDNGAQKEITNLDIASHALVFFIAGFDSTTTLISFMAYELALQPDIQNKLRMEIQNTFKECDGHLSYEALMKMKYLDMVVSESLRKWMNFPLTDRICTKKFTIPPLTPEETPVTLEPGMKVWIPIHAIHHDPKYFPEPDRFDPERFSEENKPNMNPYTYFPFGLGPRICVASRYAILKTKIIFFYLLLNFELVVTSKTVIPVVREKNGISGTSAEGGLHLGLKIIPK